MGKTVRFGVSLDEDLLRGFDDRIRRMGYTSRSEAIRDLIRNKLVEEEWDAPHELTFAVVLLVYDHHAMAAAERLLELQHHHAGEIVSTLHVHVDENNCLEVVVMRGPGPEIRDLGENLLSMRGVKYGRINMGTTGRRVR